jgi:hypothetical protein
MLLKEHEIKLGRMGALKQEDDNLHRHDCYNLKSILLAACFMLVSFLAYSPTLKMEATCPPGTEYIALCPRRQNSS